MSILKTLFHFLFAERHLDESETDGTFAVKPMPLYNRNLGVGYGVNDFYD